MPLSKIRRRGSSFTSDEPLTPEKELKIYEVFTRKLRGAAHVHAGALHAPDMQTAVELAREHYGQDETCVHIWVAKSDQLGSTNDDEGPINKAIEHSYRYVRDYQYIGKMWRKFQDDKALKAYEKDDLKQGF